MMKQKTIKFLYTQNFRNAYKKLCKKYPSLEKDFSIFQKALLGNPVGYEPNTVKIANLGLHVYLSVYKVRKFPLTCMKTKNSGLRIVYVYDPENDHLEFFEFIEIYHKNIKENHDEKLIIKMYEGKTDLPSGYATDDVL